MLPSITPVVCTGQIKPLGPKGSPSGIDKTPVSGPWTISRTGLTGDAQGDLKNHGGPEKAVHYYPFEHQAFWQGEIGPHPLLGKPGAMGENLCASGWTEDNVHIGDIVRFGAAVMQVAQGRQPCWKLNARFERTDMAFRVQTTGRTGWYHRVLEPGVVEPGSVLHLVERPQSNWPLSRLTQLLYRDKDNYGDLQKMADLTELSEGWRMLARRRIETRKVEDWTPRLEGGSRD